VRGQKNHVLSIDWVGASKGVPAQTEKPRHGITIPTTHGDCCWKILTIKISRRLQGPGLLETMQGVLSYPYEDKTHNRLEWDRDESCPRVSSQNGKGSFLNCS